MPEIKAYEPGTFCWVELSTTDAESAKKFYARLFGWKISDISLGPEGVYTMLLVEGKEAAALCQQNEEQKKQAMPAQWQSYVAVANADESAKKAEALGAKILAFPFDVFEAGRMAVLQDPSGALISLWQPKKHIGASWVNDPGGFCWNELHTHDIDRAGRFYTQLFGWTTQTDREMPMRHTRFHRGDRGLGAMTQIPMDGGALPPHWMVYFAVPDCDAAIATAQAAGGTLRAGPRDIPDLGRFAVLADREGATFGVIKLERT